MLAFEAILFDFDGVLLDSEPVHFACWAEVLKPFGVSLDWETYARHCIGVSDREMLDFLVRLCHPPASVERLWAQYPMKKELFRKRMADAPAFPPGLPDFMASLQKHFKLGVVSSSGRCEVEPLLEMAGIRRCLGAVVCGEDVLRHKPAPEPYLLAATILHVQSALVAEDSDAGMESARAAGFEAVRIPNPSRTVELVRARLWESKQAW